MSGWLVMVIINQIILGFLICVLWSEHRNRLAKKKKAQADIDRQKCRERLKLCEKHNPVSPGLPNYAEHNCDHCKLLSKFNNLIQGKTHEELFILDRKC